MDSPAPAAVGGRRLAGLLCAGQALVLVAFAAFYVYELLQGLGSDPARVAMSAVVILLGAGGLAALARAWFSGADWPRTPTVVWNVLLIPVGISLLQADRRGVATGLLLTAAVTLWAAAAAKPAREGSGAD